MRAVSARSISRGSGRPALVALGKRTDAPATSCNGTRPCPCRRARRRATCSPARTSTGSTEHGQDEASAAEGDVSFVLRVRGGRGEARKRNARGQGAGGSRGYFRPGYRTSRRERGSSRGIAGQLDVHGRRGRSTGLSVLGQSATTCGRAERTHEEVVVADVDDGDGALLVRQRHLLDDACQVL